MTAGVLNFTIEQGATFSRVLTWRDENGSPVNLTGYSAEMDIRLTPSSAELISLTTVNGRIALGGVAGTITLTISATDTDALAGWTTAVYDLELTSGAGFVTRLLSGTITYSPAVSHS